MKQRVLDLVLLLAPLLSVRFLEEKKKKKDNTIYVRAKTPFSFFLIKNYISTNYDLPIVWTIQFVSFGIIVIVDKDELLAFVIQFGSLLV